jgi:hypothetical protein
MPDSLLSIVSQGIDLSMLTSDNGAGMQLPRKTPGAI